MMTNSRRHRRLMFLGFALAAAAGVPAAADTPGRYSMSPTDGGFVRLDTQTGAMALCANKDSAWSCTDMPESADASRKRIDALEKENKSLKDEISRLEDSAAGLGPPGSEPPKQFAMPDEKDVDKAFDYIESMIKKFRERVKKLEEKDGSDGTPL
jgi:hypothetical protein